MKKTVRVAALALALTAFAQGAAALGFGRLPASATIGQPLDLAIPVRLEPGEALALDCVGAQVSFADTPQQPGTTTARLDPAAPDATERILRVRTTTRVDEPIVTVELTLGCSSRITRAFILFADPPLVSAAAPSELPSLAPPPAASGPPRVDDVPVPIAPPQAAAPPRPRRAASAAPRRPQATRSAAAAPRAAGSAPARAAGGARLRLAPLEAGTTVAAARAPAGTPAAAEAGATPASPPVGAGAMEAAALGAVAAAQEAASAASAARAAEAAATARAAELEQALQRARADSASAQQAIAALRADLDRLREGGSAGRPPWLIDLLLIALVLVLAALVWLWRQRQQDREAAGWMHAGGGPVEPDHGPEFDEPPTEASVSQTPALSAKVLAEEEPDDGGPAARSGPITMPMPVGSPAAQAEPKREVSVEELIDLEQQAEFFVVLGQDEAAIDLLMGHLRSTAGTSPLPYLKLLEIYKRRGERKPYELLRERFNGRFSAIAPAWDTDWQTGRSLEDYPAVLERLQSLWFSPARAMEVLQATLMRPAGSEHDPSAHVGFDLPAYRELMFLYAVARDRAETETGVGGVDLLLPLGEPEASEPPLVFERLVATTSLEAQPSVRQPLTVDLPIDESPTTTAAAVMLNGPSVDFDPSELPPLDPLPPRRTRE